MDKVYEILAPSLNHAVTYWLHSSGIFGIVNKYFCIIPEFEIEVAVIETERRHFLINRKFLPDVS